MIVASISTTRFNERSLRENFAWRRSYQMFVVFLNRNLWLSPGECQRMSIVSGPKVHFWGFFSISSQLPFVRRRDKADLLLLFYRDGRKLQFLSFTLALIRQDSEKCAARNLDRWSLCLAWLTQNESCNILARSVAKILWCHLMITVALIIFY